MKSKLFHLICILGVFPLCNLPRTYADHHLELHSAVNPAPRTGRQLERHQRFNQQVQDRQGPVELVFIGDSITQGWEGAGKEVWKTYYNHRNSLNLGIGGDRTQHVLWRLDHGNFDGIQPKVAVVMIGTNNSAQNRNTATEMIDGIRAVVDKIQKKSPSTKILLLGIFPSRKGNQRSAWENSSSQPGH